MLPVYRRQEDYYDAAQKGEEGQLDDSLETFEDGVIVHGLFMEAMRWNDDSMCVVDSQAGKMNSVSCESRDPILFIANFCLYRFCQ